MKEIYSQEKQRNKKKKNSSYIVEKIRFKKNEFEGLRIESLICKTNF